MVCTESITRNPCCGTNSQVAGDDTWGVILYTHAHKHSFRRAGPVGSDWRQVLCPGLLPPIQLPTGTEQGLPGACTEKKETFQNRQNLPRSALVFLPPERLGGKWPGHATLSLHPSATFPRGEHCPMARSINHGFPRYCDFSEQVKQAME